MIITSVVTICAYLFCIAVSMFYAVKIVHSYWSSPALRLCLATCGVDAWIVSNILLLMAEDFAIGDKTQLGNFIYHMGNNALFIGLVLFFQSLLHGTYSKSARFACNVTIFLITSLFAFSMGDFLLPSSVFYNVFWNGTGFWSQKLPEVDMLIILTAFCGATTAILTLIQRKKLYKSIYRFPSFIPVVIGGSIVAFIFSLFFASLFPSVYFLTPRIIVNTFFIIVIFIICLFLVFNQPLLIISGKLGNLMPLLSQGYLTYLLVTFTDLGPESIAISTKFVSRVNMNQDSLLKLNINLLTLANLSEQQTTISIIPVPALEGYTALTFGFATKNSLNKDSRLITKVPTAFAIILPSIMVISPSNLQDAFKYVLWQMENKDIATISNIAYLESLTLTILRKILI